MCGRYFLGDEPDILEYAEEAQSAKLTAAITQAFGRPLTTSGEVRPADIVPVIAPAPGSASPAVYPMSWGFHLPRTSSLLFNARVETAAEKPAFRDAWARRRCIVPASWYFEWEHLTDAAGRKKTGSKYRIRPAADGITCLAGLYRIEETAGVRVPVFTILTRPPADSIRFIHDRMPVMLSPALVEAWLSPRSDPAALARQALTDCVFSTDESP